VSCDREFWWERAWAGWWTVHRSMPPKSAVPWYVWHKGFVCMQCSADGVSAIKFFGVLKPRSSNPPPVDKAKRPKPPPAPPNRIVRDFGT